MKIFVHLIFVILLSQLGQSCQTIYETKGQPNHIWTPDLNTSSCDKKTDNIDFSKADNESYDLNKSPKDLVILNMPATKAFEKNDIKTGRFNKSMIKFERKLTDLTLKTAKALPKKIHKTSLVDRKSELPEFLTHECMSLGMTIGYRILIYCLLIAIPSLLIIGLLSHTGADMEILMWVVLFSVLAAILGFLIWFFSWIITYFMW